MFQINHNWYKKMFIIGVIFLLVLPLLYLFGLKDKTVTYGVESIGELPSLQTSSFSQKTFQSDFEKYWNTHFGMRNFMLKTKNTLYDWINFRRMHKGYFEAIIEGKNRYLFGNYLFKSVLKNCWNLPSLEKLQQVHERAQQRGIEIYFVLAPSKALTYYEYLPERYKYFLGTNCHTNEILAKAIRQIGIPVYDSQPMVERLHAKKEIEPFPIGGIHWNLYGAGMAVKESAETFQWGNIHIDRIETNNQAYSSEQDLTRLQNIFFTKHNDKIFYKPIFHSDFKLSGSTVIIGDSYSNEYTLSFQNAGISEENALIHYANEP
ncbi:MAG: hypothetical protein IJ852_02560 [Alphaproteobacteria bacterium]|nr:hypothetical protein [Alphaproteobacteria bacterium]